MIILVVTGHFLQPTENGGVILALSNWIYLFHMPAFIFASGVFSKSYAANPKVNKAFGFLVIYFVFRFGIWAIDSIFAHRFLEIHFLTTSGAPWYLFFIFLCHIIIPYFKDMSFSKSMSISVLTSVLFYTFEMKSTLLCAIPLFISFFPFFLLGYHFKTNLYEEITLMCKLIGVIVMFLLLIVVYREQAFIQPYMFIVYGAKTFAESGITNSKGIVVLMFWYIVSISMTFSLLVITPKNRCILSYIGQKTLSIYILHLLIRNIVRYLGFFEIANGNVLFLVAFSIGLTLLTANNNVDRFIRKAFKINW